MSFQPLKTKIEIPKTLQKRVTRSRLTEMIEGSKQCKVTLVCAPAGYGKTAALCEWANTTKHSIAWISLDKSENDPIRFFSYLIHALQHIIEPKGLVESFLYSNSDKMLEILIPTLINTLTDVEEEIFLVLDDFHLIGNQIIHELLSQIVERAPHQFHLIVSTRVEPLLNLERLRVSNELLEVRQSELAFTESESIQFLLRLNKLNLDLPEARSLIFKSEGWIAGLNLGAMIIHRNNDAKELIEVFSGKQTYIMDYLVGEAFAGQSEDVQTFLLETSILKDLSADLCDAVTDRSNSGEVLKQIVDDNLFIIQLDQQREWFRYHHLFAEVLQNLLSQKDTGGIKKLKLRASHWYESNGQIDEAIQFALEADKLDRAASLIQKNTLAAVYQGERERVRVWLEKLPEYLLEERPDLCLLHAWAIMNDKTVAADTLIAKRLQTAEHFLLNQQKTAYTDTGDAVSLRHLLQTANFLKAIVSFERGKPSRLFLPQLQEIIKDHSGSGNELVSWTLYLMARIQLRSLDYDEAVSSLADLVSITKQQGDRFLTVYATYLQCWILLQSSHYHQALRLCTSEFAAIKNLFNCSSANLPILESLRVIEGSIYLEWDQPEKAEEILEAALKALNQTTEIGIIAYGTIALLQAKYVLERDRSELMHLTTELQFLGKYHKALLPLAESVQLDKKHPKPINPNELISKLIWSKKELPPAELNYYQDYDWGICHDLNLIESVLSHLQSNKTSLHQEVKEALIDFLQDQRYSSENKKLKRTSVRLSLALASVYELSQDLEKAEAILQDAVKMAEKEGMLRPFLDWAYLLPKSLGLIKLSVESDFTKRLIVASGSTHSGQTLLSEREWEVFQLIENGSTNQQIAKELFISLNTVKTHITSIYNKLGVNKRTQAISKMKELQGSESQ